MDYDSLLLWGIGLTAILYAVYRYMGRSVQRSEIDREMQEVLHSSQYQVRGRFGQ